MLGLTAKELAREQGVTETAIRIRFLRSRRAARRLLEKRSPRSPKVGGRLVAKPMAA
jgi:DNA-directed RNA polymerase specialized sigma24 family protein